MPTNTLARRSLCRRLATILMKLHEVAEELAEIGEEGIRASLMDAIARTDEAGHALHEVAETKRSPRGPRSKLPVLQP